VAKNGPSRTSQTKKRQTQDMYICTLDDYIALIATIQNSSFATAARMAPRNIQGDFESCADILITSYWLHVELGKNDINFLSYNFFKLFLVFYVVLQPRR
jgi:hypothetical protein